MEQVSKIPTVVFWAGMLSFFFFFSGTPPSGGKPAGAEAILVSTWSSRRQLYTPSQVLTEEVATSAECL